MEVLKLPRQLEAEPEVARRIEATLSQSRQKLWAGGQREVVEVDLTGALKAELVRVQRFGQLERGLEGIQRLLDQEKKGLEAARAKQGAASAHRISRLVLIANDGAERFYRACESLLNHHGDRLIVLKLNVTSEVLGCELFGPQTSVKALLVSEKNAVVAVLRALVAQ